jgi:hypothetical protein
MASLRLEPHLRIAVFSIIAFLIMYIARATGNVQASSGDDRSCRPPESRGAVRLSRSAARPGRAYRSRCVMWLAAYHAEQRHVVEPRAVFT